MLDSTITGEPPSKRLIILFRRIGYQWGINASEDRTLSLLSLLRALTFTSPGLIHVVKSSLASDSDPGDMGVVGLVPGAGPWMGVKDNQLSIKKEPIYATPSSFTVLSGAAAGACVGAASVLTAAPF